MWIPFGAHFCQESVEDLKSINEHDDNDVVSRRSIGRARRSFRNPSYASALQYLHPSSSHFSP
jgi:hypothetical protein